MQPLFRNVALNSARQHDWCGVQGKEKANRGRHEKERQKVFQFSADVAAIEWPLMMIPVKRIQALVKELANQPFPRRKAAMQHISVKQVLHQGPREATDDVKRYGEPRMV